MSKELTVKLTLTERELWEMSELFSARYVEGGWGNPVAEGLGVKLKKAEENFKTMKRKT